MADYFVPNFKPKLYTHTLLANYYIPQTCLGQISYLLCPPITPITHECMLTHVHTDNPCCISFKEILFQVNPIIRFDILKNNVFRFKNSDSDYSLIYRNYQMKACILLQDNISVYRQEISMSFKWHLKESPNHDLEDALEILSVSLVL